MPTRDKSPVGVPCWVDLLTSDTERARDFYATVLGWKAEEPSEEFGGYFMFTRGGVPVAGGMGNQSPAETPDAWSIYLCVADADATIATATQNGATVIVPGMKVADLGTMAMLLDPGGAAIGLWAPGQFGGFGVYGESGAPVWFELHTRDYDKALAFYKGVFGWTTGVVSDSEEFRYSTVQDGDAAVAGVYDARSFLQDEERSHWTVYFGVDSTDDAVAKVLKLGGSVRRPAEDTPYGRMATVADPMQTEFRLMTL